MDEIYREYATPVYKYLFSITSNHTLAEELTQETFYQALISLHRYNGECKLLVWLCQIAKHLYFDYLKKEKRRSHNVDIEQLDNEVIASVQDTPEAEFLAKEDAKLLYNRLHKLSEPYKEVMLLRISGDLSFKDIGEIMEQTETWARVTFYRAKSKILKGNNNHG